MIRIAIAIALTASLTGCAIYTVDRPDGLKVRIASTREFPNGITIEGTSKDGASFKASAGSVTNSNPLEQLGLLYLQSLAPRAVAPAEPKDDDR